MSHQHNSHEALRHSLKSDLAREIGCNIECMPTAVSLDIAGRFIGVSNKNTFYIWKHAKRYPLVWLKRGRSLEIGSESLIDLRLSQAELPEVAA